MPTKIPVVRLLPAIAALALIVIAIAAGCERTGITLPPAQAEFLSQGPGVFFVTGAGITDTIPVGVTTVAGTDRTILVTVSSTTGAIAGTQYSLVSDSVVIPAGKATGYIVVQGNFGFYNGSIRKDTLLFTLSGNGGIAPSDFNDSFTLVMRGPCIEGEDFDPLEFNGTYNNVVDSYAGSSSMTYSTQITTISSTPTSAILIVQNLGYEEFGVNSSDTVALDWSNPPNLIATVISQPYFVIPGYGAAVINMDAGTFSSCHQTFVLNYDVVIAGLDYGVFTTTIAR